MADQLWKNVKKEVYQQFPTWVNEETFQKRQKETSFIRSKYPERIPIWVLWDKSITKLAQTDVKPKLFRNKFLVPFDFTMGMFSMYIRRRMKKMNVNGSDSVALFFSVPNHTVWGTSSMVPMNKYLNTIYWDYGQSDGFLYIRISNESVFGCESFNT